MQQQYHNIFKWTCILLVHTYIISHISQKNSLVGGSMKLAHPPPPSSFSLSLSVPFMRNFLKLWSKASSESTYWIWYHSNSFACRNSSSYLPLWTSCVLYHTQLQPFSDCQKLANNDRFADRSIYIHFILLRHDRCPCSMRYKQHSKKRHQAGFLCWRSLTGLSITIDPSNISGIGSMPT